MDGDFGNKDFFLLNLADRCDQRFYDARRSLCNTICENRLSPSLLGTSQSLLVLELPLISFFLSFRPGIRALLRLVLLRSPRCNHALPRTFFFLLLFLIADCSFQLNCRATHNLAVHGYHSLATASDDMGMLSHLLSLSTEFNLHPTDRLQTIILERIAH
jgi:hypothetical protein